MRSPRSARRHELDVLVFVAEGRLEMSWTFSRERYETAKMQALLDQTMQELKQGLLRDPLPSRGNPEADEILDELLEDELEDLLDDPDERGDA